MKFPFTCIASSLLLVAAAPAENLLVIGDSLSKEYQVEYAGIGGNLSAAHVRNWCEILDARRSASFSMGNFGSHADWRLVGHDYNWSIPGSFAADWRDYLDSASTTPDDLVSQLRNNVDRVVVWLGGNDIRSRYGDFYDGGSTVAWIDKVESDIKFVVEWVRSQNPDIPMVMAGVPHVGCTPSKSEAHPYDPVKTGRVTAALDTLNARLKSYALRRGLGWADTYGMTRELVTASRWVIGGYRVEKVASSSGDPDALFMGDGFHPNWPAQAVFAQRFVNAFNERYGMRLPRLTNREIVKDVLGEDADLSLSQWTQGYAIPSGDRGFADDPDGDRIKNIVEFALDLDPTRPDTQLLPQPYVARINGLDYLSLTWQARDPDNNTFALVTPQESTLLGGWTTVPGIAQGANYSRTVRKRLNAGPRGFLRLQATHIP